MCLAPWKHPENVGSEQWYSLGSAGRILNKESRLANQVGVGRMWRWTGDREMGAPRTAREEAVEKLQVKDGKMVTDSEIFRLLVVEPQRVEGAGQDGGSASICQAWSLHHRGPPRLGLVRLTVPALCAFRGS